MLKLSKETNDNNNYSQESAAAHVTSSDEVEARVPLFKLSVDNGRFLVAASTLSDQSSQSVGVSNAGRFLDRTRHVVVREAHLVSEQLDFVWRLLDLIVDDAEPSRVGHALASGHTDEVELVSVAVSHRRIDDCASHRVLEPADVTTEDSSVDSLAAVHVHELAGVLQTKALEGTLDLLDLG